MCYNNIKCSIIFRILSFFLIFYYLIKTKKTTNTYVQGGKMYMRKTKRAKSIVAKLTAGMMILGCLVIPEGTVSHAAGKKLKVTYHKTVAVNCTTTIKTNMKAKFKTSNKKIATVSSKGIVKGKKPGKVKITVTAKNNKKLKKTVTITVKNQLVIKEPQQAKVTLNAGEQTSIKTNLSSTFTSSNPTVATVSANGVVTAKQAGTTKITVTSKKNKKLKKTVTITVTDEITETPSVPTEVSTTEQVTTVVPTTEVTTTEQTATVVPTTEVTTTEQTTTTVSTTEIPTTEISITEEVTTEILTTQESTTEIPTTEAPTTEYPIKPVPIGIEAITKAPGRSISSMIDGNCFIVTLKYSDGSQRILEYYEYNMEFTEEGDYIVYEYEDSIFRIKADIETISREEASRNIDFPSYLRVTTDKEELTLEDMNDKSNFTVVAQMESGEEIELKPEDYYICIYNSSKNQILFVYTYYFDYNGEQYFVNATRMVRVSN